MPTVEFKPGRSVDSLNTNICEIHIDGQMVATIYPSDESGIRIISKYRTKGRARMDGLTDINTVEINFEIP